MYPTSNTENENQVLEGFIKWLNSHDISPNVEPVTLFSRPDKSKKEWKGGCDAVLCRGNNKNAVEITTIEPLKDMQKSAARLLPIKEHLLLFLKDYNEVVFLEVFIQEDQLPRRFKSELIANAIIQAIKMLAPGNSQKISIYGSDISVSRSDFTPDKSLLFMHLSTNNDMEHDLEVSIIKSIDTNLREKLIPAKREGCFTSLILDARENSLNEQRVANIFSKVWPRIKTDDLDEVWIARTNDLPIRFVPLKQGDYVYLNDITTFHQFQLDLNKAWNHKPKNE